MLFPLFFVMIVRKVKVGHSVIDMIDGVFIHSERVDKGTTNYYG